MKKLFTFCAIISLFLSSEYAFSQTNTWDGSSGTSWGMADNWSLGHVPLSTEDVVIPSAPLNQPSVSGIAAVCQNLTINTGSTLNITATTLNNATLTASGNATVGGALSMSGSLTKTAKLTVVSMTWASGSSHSGYLNSSIEVGGDWEFSSGSAVSMGLTSVTFTGAANAQLYSKSAGSQFAVVTINKGTGNGLFINSTSTATLKFGSTVTITSGSLIGQANITTIFYNNFNNSGNFSFNSGTVSLEKSSGTQYIQAGVSNAFYNLTVNTGGTVTFGGTALIKKDLLIQAGVLDPLGNMVEVWGNWTNSVGTSGFTEGASRVIFSGASGHQYCSDETFNIIDINKTTGALRANGTDIICAAYDWTAGSVDVLNNGTFTADDLTDNGIYGGFYVNPGCTINLHQDAGQFIDLGATLNFNGGGTINIYGGSSVSVWGFNDDATVTMNGGILDFKNQGIKLLTAVPYTVTTNITGGTIRTTGSYYSNRATFNPAGGTLELYGPSGKSMEVTAGSVRNLLINKDPGVAVTLASGLTVNGSFTTGNGVFIADNKIVTVGGNLTVNDDGIFHLGPNSQLKMAGDMTITINDGGTMETYGTGADQVLVTHSAGYYYLYVMPGGTISSKYTTFQYSYNLIIGNNAIIDPANAFYHCTFANFTTASFLAINNTQTISLHEVNFPTLPPVNNVSKNSNAGYLYFKDATGAYAGAAYEYDPYNRISWSASVPGRWTGEISSDWYTAQNWDDYAVPTAATSVTIPSGTTFSPVISAGDAYCNDITILSGAALSVGLGDLNVAGNMTVHGQLEMTNAGGGIVIAGSIYWEAGSTANFTANGKMYVAGDWEFRNGANAQLDNGYVYFTGASTSYIRSYEAGCSFRSLLNSKTGGYVYLSSSSTDSLKITGYYSNQSATSWFYSASDYPIVLKQQLYNYGHIYCAAGTFIFDGVSQNIDLNTGDFFNNIIISPSADVILADSLRVRGNLTIDGGVLVTNDYPILIRGNWANNAGASAFEEGTGKVTFEGTGPSDILTDETFYNLKIDKTYASLDGVEVNDSVSVISNLVIADGTMEMNSGSRLHVGNQLMISVGAGLNANDADVEIYSEEDWYDSNPAPTTTVGFNAGTSSVVHFLGKTANVQTIQESCPFNDVVVKGAGTYARPDFYNIVCRNLSITAGRLLLGGYKITVNANVNVGAGTLQMSSAGDSLVVLGDITWQPGSNDIITDGVILAGGDWIFQNGTNAVLGTGNTVIFNRAPASMIQCDDSNASFGNLVIGKPAGPSAEALIHVSSIDTMRVAGTMTVNAGNQFHVQSDRLAVDGNLDIQSTGEMDMTAGGYLLNNYSTFVLNGKLNVNTGTALVHGTFYVAVTGELDIAGGSFTSDAPVTGTTWQHMGGIFNMSSGTFKITNNSVSILASAVTNISGGTIITGYAFSAEHAGTFHPTGGLVKCTCSHPAEAYIYCTGGNYFHDLEISGTMGLHTDVTVKHNFLISSGWLHSETHDMYIEGNWTNNVGPGGFIENGKTVYFTGFYDADITTSETFSNMVVAKTGTSASSLAVATPDTVNVTNDLSIQDGCLNIQGHVRLFVSGDLVIASGAGLNADASFPNYIQVSGNWTNGNVTSIGNNVGFKPGSYCVVTFNGNSDSYLSTSGAQEQFAHIFIEKSGASFRSNDNIWTRNLKIRSGTWDDNVPGLHHQVTQGFDVLAAGSMQNNVAHNTVEFFGGPGSFSYLSSTGCMYNVIFNAQADSYFHLETDLNCLFGGSLTVQSGRLYANGHRIWVEGNVAVNDYGWLKMLDGSELVMTNGNTLDVNSGGRLDLYGMTLRADPPNAHYAFNINSGGTLDAGGSVIKNTGINGLYLKPGSILMDDDYSAGLDGCTFSDGTAGGTLLRIDNDQTLTIRNAVFPANTWSGAYNVTKTVAGGQVYFVDFTGGFSGEAYDNDGYGHVTWVPAMSVTASASPSTICAGSSSQLSTVVTGGMPPFSYYWNPSAGLSDPFAANPAASPAETTTYQLEVYDFLGTQALGTIPVTVLPVLPVSVSIAASANPSPPGSFVSFSATPVNGGPSPAYQWKVNGLNAGTGMPSFSYVPANGDDVTCLLTSGYQCPSGNPATSNMITMVIVPVNTSVAGTVPSPLAVCFDASGTVTVAGGGNTFLVESGGSATMIAGVKISYLYGTTVLPGGYMHGYITTANEYCGSLPPSMVSVVVSGIDGGYGNASAPAPPPVMFSVYPNPTGGMFTLIQRGGTPAGTTSVEIFSMRGERLRVYNLLNEQKHVFNVSEFPAGLYFLKVVKDEQTETIKLIVNK